MNNMMLNDFIFSDWIQCGVNNLDILATPHHQVIHKIFLDNNVTYDESETYAYSLNKLIQLNDEKSLGLKFRTINGTPYIDVNNSADDNIRVEALACDIKLLDLCNFAKPTIFIDL